MGSRDDKRCRGVIEWIRFNRLNHCGRRLRAPVPAASAQCANTHHHGDDGPHKRRVSVHWECCNVQWAGQPLICDRPPRLNTDRERARIERDHLVRSLVWMRAKSVVLFRSASMSVVPRDEAVSGKWREYDIYLLLGHSLKATHRAPNRPCRLPWRPSDEPGTRFSV